MSDNILVRRQSGYSQAGSPTEGLSSPFLSATSLAQNTEEWRRIWGNVNASSLVDRAPPEIDEDATVESACDMLLKENVSCLIVKSSTKTSRRAAGCIGLFDFADVNAFLTLAGTQHTLSPAELDANPRMKDVVDAAKAGRVPVRLVANLSDKNPLIVLPDSSSLIDLLQVFSRGTHRVVVHTKTRIAQAPASPSSLVPQSQSNPRSQITGLISDRQTLSWFLNNAHSFTSPSLDPLLSSTLLSLNMITSQVKSCSAEKMVLDAMEIMSTEGLSSLPIVDSLNGRLISVVSVNDIGKLVVPSQNKAILTLPLSEFVKQIKGPVGMTDGKDRYPIYSIGARSTLSYAMQMLLATKAHRVCVVDDSEGGAAMNRFGIVSVVDVLSRLATLASIDPDPNTLQRHRRASSSSSSRSHSSSRPSSLLSSVSSLGSLPDPLIIQKARSSLGP